MKNRTEKIANIIKELSAQFLERETNKTSLITVTGADCSPDFRRATVFITVLPESKETAALNFTRRKRRELREYIKKNINIKTIPFLEIEIDRGEKNRQKIDELLRNG
ncbi:hypothetical protein A3G06_02825 [Candidatus Nomurabacteria bacterium RIFCSPLOWO2_12_FULL_46_14]|uniref:Ribosome-binding factor A n=1 Tax=Candidatus Nomurabacteria bacterium RIFCSPLOWO2_12_FULL_46_14 TaxID=1801797 RepID=A0A1F6Y812_9BACT|nr:MAG: hypothetical protein A3G06_02825 [Candidatus Nomurabacteria bacterium RIFCSPLOWO2_12_FULL_46_14]